ncbi:hypothetical protein Aperf_G00000066936 [Anoplocephala perfoliata]
MESIEKNLGDEALSLVVSGDNVRKKKKMLFVSNVILSFVGKLPFPKKSIHANLPHRPSGVDVCVIVKDLKKTDYNASNDLWKRKWKSDAANTPGFAVTFLPVTELKLCYQTFEAKRKLAATFDVFLADKRIVHHLPTNLGKAFYGKARDKIPIPVSLSGNNLVKAVQKALSSCLVHFSGNGTTESVVIGTTSLSKLEIKENALSVIKNVVDKFPTGLKTFRSIYIRGSGPSVPIHYDNSGANVEESKANLDEIKRQISAESDRKSSLANLPVGTLLEATKSLPISESDLKSILAKAARRTVRTLAKTSSVQKNRLRVKQPKR